MAKLTLSKLKEVKRILEKETIKPYKGFIGMKMGRFFEIKNEEEFIRLKRL